MGLTTRKDLINHLKNLYLEKKYVKKEEREAKLDEFRNQFGMYDESILIQGWEEWNAGYSSKLPANKDFFDDFSRYRNICDRIWVNQQGQKEFERQGSGPTKEFHDAIKSIDLTPVLREFPEIKTIGQAMVEMYERQFERPAIAEFVKERKLDENKNDKLESDLILEEGKRYCYYCLENVVRPHKGGGLNDLADYYECSNCNVKYQIEDSNKQFAQELKDIE